MVTIKNILKDNLLSTGYFINNDYLDKYIDLILSNFDTQKSISTQAHHIIPKHYYSHNELSVNNTLDNLVNLQFSDHIKAHYFLSLCSANPADRISNEAALIRMIGKKDVTEYDLEKYNDLYSHYQEYNRQKHLGTHHDTSSETRAKISAANKGLHKGDIHIYKDDIEKHISPSVLDDYISQGWQIGRSQSAKDNLSKHYNYNVKGMLGKSQSDHQKTAVSNALTGIPKSDIAKSNMSNARKGKQLVSNEKINKSLYISPEEVQSYLDNGFHLGRLNK